MIGKDIRQLGSGNVGARNAGRLLGRKGFVYTALIDVAKTMIALYTTTLLFPQQDMMLLVSAFFLLLGHNWPLFLGFKGGKGVAVFLAFTLFVVPQAIVVLGISVAILYLLIRNFTIAGLISMATIPITAWALEENTFAIGLFCLLIVVVLSHLKGNRTN
ncbi:glycerol-3-phosphate acyltransferase [Mesobacillus maritimus]|nr:glycerol-3-phosphate acyltransferase [Mesobacillus maritimus]MCM3670486.1 glycerol-3-phosphate acyltransferase [Mesobacillus maritimus]